MTGTRRRSAWRTIGLTLVGLACILPLTGCFVIPLVDNRSPFDDPFGASRADIANALPVVQEALDQVGTQDGLWRYDAERGQDNCEGACDLRVEVRIVPVGDPSAYPEADPEADPTLVVVPEQVLRDVLVAAVPAAEGQRGDVRVLAGNVDDLRSDLDEAVETVFGPLPDDGLYEEAFSVVPGFSPGDAAISARTRDHEGVLDAMGLT